MTIDIQEFSLARALEKMTKLDYPFVQEHQLLG
jgi:hypothetical protein